MPKMDQSKPPTDKNDRRRGRPAGKNRVPLSIEERRARNAQYERERRNETAEAMTELAEAAKCDPQITNPELLATVISRLQEVNRKPPQSIDDLKRINDNLESQISELQNRLNSDTNDGQTNVNEHLDRAHYEPDSDTESSTQHRPVKYRKATIESTVHTNTAGTSSPSSSDSHDSIWSHHMGKTLPKPELLEPQCGAQVGSETQRTSSSSERRDLSSTENEFYSNTQLKGSPKTMNRQQVKVEIQLVSREEQTKAKVDQPGLSFADPFTEREKRILERLGCRDFFTFENSEDEVQDDATLSWPLDFDDFLAGFS